jgi:hypothetical protein
MLCHLYSYQNRKEVGRRFFKSESGSVYNGSESAFLNPNPEPCIMDPDPHFLKEGVTIVSHSLPPPPPPGGGLSQFLEY